MANENARGGRHPLRLIGMVAGAALLLALTLVVVRPWPSAAPASNNTSMASAQAAGTLTVSIPVEGMICMVCASSVKRTAQAVEGVTNAEVDLAGKRAKVAYVEGQTSPELIASAIARLGYKTGAPVVEKRP